VPGSPELAALEAELGSGLPSALHEAYAAPAPGFGPLRLLRVDEVRDTYAALQDFGLPDSIVPFWTDDQSNYAALYVRGPLASRVCFVDHDEIDLVPAYVSVESFSRAAAAAAGPDTDWSEMPRDYPRLSPSPLDAEESALASSLRTAAVDSDDDTRAYLLHCAMVLTPANESDTLRADLCDRDMWVQERACTLLGQRRVERAIEDLVRVAREGMHNGRLAAIRALGDIGTETCRQRLEELEQILPTGFTIHVRAALRRCHPT